MAELNCESDDKSYFPTEHTERRTIDNTENMSTLKGNELKTTVALISPTQVAVAKESTSTTSADDVLAFQIASLNLNESPKDTRPINVVYFDLETTSVNKDCSILQLAACYQDSLFDQYIIPDEKIHAKASEVNGLTEQGGVLFYRGDKVNAIPLKQCLEAFLEWLQPYKPALLVAHNCLKFDAVRLLHQMNQKTPDLLPVFTKVVAGFADTLPLFRNLFKDELSSFTQANVAKHVIGPEFVYEAHNAVEDVKVLRKIVEKSGQLGNLKNYEVSVDNIQASLNK